MFWGCIDFVFITELKALLFSKLNLLSTPSNPVSNPDTCLVLLPSSVLQTTMSPNSRSSSNFDVRSVSSTSSSARLAGRVDIVFPGGRRIAVPVDSTTSFEDLREDIVKRASRSRIAIPQGDLTLRLDSADGAEAYLDDTVTDVLRLDDKPTLWLNSVHPDQVRMPHANLTRPNNC
jgi:hypothetical protein